MLASIDLHLTLLKESFSLNHEFIGWLDRLANKIVSSSCPHHVLLPTRPVLGLWASAAMQVFTRVL